MQQYRRDSGPVIEMHLDNYFTGKFMSSGPFDALLARRGSQFTWSTDLLNLNATENKTSCSCPSSPTSPTMSKDVPV